MIGNNENIRAVVSMFQNGAQHLVEGYVLVGKGVGTNVVHLCVVTDIVGRNGIEPVSRAVFAGLDHPREVRGMFRQ